MQEKQAAALGAHLLPLLIAAAGGYLFFRLGLPAPWLSGAMCAVAAAGLWGVPIRISALVRDLGFLMAGVALGAAVTEEMLAAVARYPASILIMSITMVLVMLVGRAVLMRFGWDSMSALLASSPGALTTVMATAIAENARVDRIAIAQSFRLFILIAVLPSVVVASVPGEAIAPRALMSPETLALTVLAALACGLFFQRIGLAAGLMLGGMIGSAGLHLTHVAMGDVPRPLVDMAMVLIGVQSGQRFAGLTLREMARLLPASLAAFIIAAVLAVLGALLASALTGVPIGVALVAFAPGALEAMIALSLSLGLDPLYVTSHHVVRFFGIGFALPVVALWLKRK